MGTSSAPGCPAWVSSVLLIPCRSCSLGGGMFQEQSPPLAVGGRVCWQPEPAGRRGQVLFYHRLGVWQGLLQVCRAGTPSPELSRAPSS